MFNLKSEIIIKPSDSNIMQLIPYMYRHGYPDEGTTENTSKGMKTYTKTGYIYTASDKEPSKD